MNRTYTSITVLAMVLIAVGLCVRHTIEFRELLDTLSIAAIFTIEGVVAGAVVASIVSLLRRRFARQKKPVSRRPIAVAVQA